MMKVSVNKWGNSKGIRLPKAVTEALDIDVYDYLELEIINNLEFFQYQKMR